MTVTRINSGIYDVQHNGAKYELERYPDGAWLLFSALSPDATQPREYLNDYATKRAALAALAAL